MAAANMLEQTREKFSKRLAELRPMVEEARELERVLDAMGGTKTKKRSTTASAPVRTRAGRGDRPQQFLKLVEETPGITAAQAAKKMDAASSYIYRLAGELAKDGKVRKIDSGYHPVPVEQATETEVEDSAPEPVAV